MPVGLTQGFAMHLVKTEIKAWHFYSAFSWKRISKALRMARVKGDMQRFFYQIE